MITTLRISTHSSIMSSPAAKYLPARTPIVAHPSVINLLLNLEGLQQWELKGLGQPIARVHSVDPQEMVSPAIPARVWM